MRKLTTLSIIALAAVLVVGVVAKSGTPNALATRNGAGGVGDTGGNGNSGTSGLAPSPAVGVSTSVTLRRRTNSGIGCANIGPLGNC